MSKVLKEGDVLFEEQVERKAKDENGSVTLREIVKKIEKFDMGGIMREFILIEIQIISPDPFSDDILTAYRWEEINTTRYNACGQTSNEFWVDINQEKIQEYIDTLIKMKEAMEF